MVFTVSTQLECLGMSLSKYLCIWLQGKDPDPPSLFHINDLCTILPFQKVGVGESDSETFLTPSMSNRDGKSVLKEFIDLCTLESPDQLLKRVSAQLSLKIF